MASNGDYFSLQDILASNQKVQSRFEVPFPKMGFMDPSNGSDDIPKQTKMEIPLWLAQALVSQQQATIRIEIPYLFTEKYMQILSADAEVVDLHKLCPMFYEFGIGLLKFTTDDMLQLTSFLTKTYTTRIAWIFDKAQHSLEEEKPIQMDKLESELYNIGKKSQEDYLNWSQRIGEQILPANQNLVSTRKRKFLR